MNFGMHPIAMLIAFEIPSTALQDMMDGLAALMDSIRMMHTIARYYSTPQRMTTLFTKITNQMIAKCKEHITPDTRKPEKLWQLPKLELVAKMQARRPVLCTACCMAATAWHCMPHVARASCSAVCGD